MTHRPVRDRVASWLRKLARLIASPVHGREPDAALRDGLIEHIAHEIAAMEAAADLHQKTNLWIALEDFLLHARVLAEFFWPGESARCHPDSAVLAEHYHKPWHHTNGGPPLVFQSTREVIDKQLAHISRERVTTPQDLAANVPALQAGIWDAWKRFLVLLDQDPSAAKFKEHLKARAAVLKITPPAGAI